MTRVKKLPQRMCVGCRQMKNKRDLIRVVRNQDGEISLDRIGKKPGRGAYLCPNIGCFKDAVKGKRLQKALDHDIPPQVMIDLEKEFVPNET
ncbi:MAG: RNase P modulator RnpM [Methylocystaceae bacterium]